MINPTSELATTIKSVIRFACVAFVVAASVGSVACRKLSRGADSNELSKDNSTEEEELTQVDIIQVNSAEEIEEPKRTEWRGSNFISLLKEQVGAPQLCSTILSSVDPKNLRVCQMKFKSNWLGTGADIDPNKVECIEPSREESSRFMEQHLTEQGFKSGFYKFRRDVVVLMVTDPFKQDKYWASFRVTDPRGERFHQYQVNDSLLCTLHSAVGTNSGGSPEQLANLIIDDIRLKNASDKVQALQLMSTAIAFGGPIGAAASVIVNAGDSMTNPEMSRFDAVLSSALGAAFVLIPGGRMIGNSARAGGKAGSQSMRTLEIAGKRVELAGVGLGAGVGVVRGFQIGQNIISGNHENTFQYAFESFFGLVPSGIAIVKLRIKQPLSKAAKVNTQPSSAASNSGELADANSLNSKSTHAKNRAVEIASGTEFLAVNSMTKSLGELLAKSPSLQGSRYLKQLSRFMRRPSNQDIDIVILASDGSGGVRQLRTKSSLIDDSHFFVPQDKRKLPLTHVIAWYRVGLKESYEKIKQCLASGSKPFRFKYVVGEVEFWDEAIELSEEGVKSVDQSIIQWYVVL